MPIDSILDKLKCFHRYYVLQHFAVLMLIFLEFVTLISFLQYLLSRLTTGEGLLLS